ncbi:MAG: helix-turn-helix transcriptional regulator [Firmicutes bacterium]|nr:helix-turn-helix transcriptional regulator [Bacillota bacterium]
MTKSEIGKIIRQRRRELGIKQKVLCHGICSESMLSKTESGTAPGDPVVLEMLLERLGFGSEILGEVNDSSDYIIRQKIREANQADRMGDRDKAWEIMNSLADGYDGFSAANKQRYKTLETVMLHEDGKITDSERLARLEESLRLTVKEYSLHSLPPLMTKTEIQILSYIANTYHYMGDNGTAVKILFHAKKFIEEFYIDKMASAIELSDICYNLSKYLALEDRYDEAIDAARQSIECHEYARYYEGLPECMYNCAWSLSRRNQADDRDKAKKLAIEARALCNAKIIHADTLPSQIDNFLAMLHRLESPHSFSRRA